MPRPAWATMAAWVRSMSDRLAERQRHRIANPVRRVRLPHRPPTSEPLGPIPAEVILFGLLVCLGMLLLVTLAAWFAGSSTPLNLT